ncbi:MAG: DNA-3-methyladenine glycosylase 2 family protein [Planctomycetes bacterium]|nr:DNA-3-methyladenine glycosylase 2 family protein [Planctomycetota bacterium]MCB9935794.1 DNA-3-methyladenine glycosylase 2 family protein [Planctomycetota bacterium]
MSKLDFDWDSAAAHVGKRDKRIGALIRRHGELRLEPRPLRSPFHALMRAIIYQQLSGKAAGTIHGRLLAQFKGAATAEKLLKLTDGQIRGAGVSGGKMKALRDLAARAVDGEVPGFARLRRMDDAEIIERLTAVHGVGRWTVEMLLIFQLGRPDVLPVHDLGVRKGFAIAHKLPELPTPDELTEHAERWRPFRTVGSWYCWRATDS